MPSVRSNIFLWLMAGCRTSKHALQVGGQAWPIVISSPPGNRNQSGLCLHTADWCRGRNAPHYQRAGSPWLRQEALARPADLLRIEAEAAAHCGSRTCTGGCIRSPQNTRALASVDLHAHRAGGVSARQPRRSRARIVAGVERNTACPAMDDRNTLPQSMGPSGSAPSLQLAFGAMLVLDAARQVRPRGNRRATHLRPIRVPSDVSACRWVQTKVIAAGGGGPLQGERGKVSLFPRATAIWCH